MTRSTTQNRSATVAATLAVLFVALFAAPPSLSQDLGSGSELRAESPCLSLGGTAKYRIRGSRLKYKVQRIANRCGVQSGKLRLALWAAPAPFGGGTLTGFVLGRGKLPRLGPGIQLRNVRFKQNLDRPPSDSYVVVMTLLEKVDGRWFIADWLNFSGRVDF